MGDVENFQVALNKWKEIEQEVRSKLPAWCPDSIVFAVVENKMDNWMEQNE